MKLRSQEPLGYRLDQLLPLIKHTDFEWLYKINQNQSFFVTRSKTNTKYRVIERRKVLKNKGLRSDQTILLTGTKAKNCPIKLRRIGYFDSKNKKHYIFLTNNFKLAAKTIADIYKQRWQIEIFFKWVKQHLKIKKFFGRSKNAVLIQIGCFNCHAYYCFL